MQHRKLQIAWSVACAVALLILSTLWIRTHYWRDTIRRPTTTQGWLLRSEAGRFGVVVHHQGVPRQVPREWCRISTPNDESQRRVLETLFPTHDGFLGFSYACTTTRSGLLAPYWAVVLFGIVILRLPQLRSAPFRFSLRTLLLATTLSAVGLGLIIWFTR